MVDFYGCLDSDNDGWSVLTDLDDNDPFEQEDTDNDTIGDNGDQCPYQWSNLIFAILMVPFLKSR